MADQAQEGLLSPFLRKKRMKKIRRFIRGNLLDFGCGSGILIDIAGIPKEQYIGLEIDRESRNNARQHYPSYTFVERLPSNMVFDTIILLAVLEHLEDPVGIMRGLSSVLSSKGRVVLTTPHPRIKRIYSIGARFGLFSSHAEEEHHDLFTKWSLLELAERAGFYVSYYSRFQLGMNQICVFDK